VSVLSLSVGIAAGATTRLPVPTLAAMPALDSYDAVLPSMATDQAVERPCWRWLEAASRWDYSPTYGDCRLEEDETASPADLPVAPGEGR
jgi:hypothetical protein